MTSRIVPVELGSRRYEIVIGTDRLAELGSQMRTWLGASADSPIHVVLVTDENLEDQQGDIVAEALAEAHFEVDVMVIEPGETAKNVETCYSLWETMLEVGTDRKSVVVAYGGGVVGDTAGYVAASFARGLRFIQLPTTLLAMVDSSVGGKTGVNLGAAKNMVGAFWQPSGVWIDTAMLKTLPDREYLSGLAEIVKYGVIMDADFFGELETLAPALVKRDPEALQRVIARSCECKAQVVAEDETETTGRRAILNYGHTFGHAFEALTGYEKLLHGEAISIGMDAAARLAERLGRVDTRFVVRQRELLEACGLPTALPDLEPEAVLEAMSHDKKVEHRKLRFVLPTRLGHVELVGDVPSDDVLAVLKP